MSGQPSLANEYPGPGKASKYLGAIIDAPMTFCTHIKDVRNRAAFILSGLHSMTCKRSKMSPSQ